MSSKRITTAVRLPEDLHARLHEAADDRDLSANFIITKALEDFLQRLIPPEEFSLVRRPGDPSHITVLQ